ncbi:MAG TPA: Asp-tRNA(Asn)/Glu-tRNA(Gln) amidotransferase subunit GatB [Anaerolineales bacterium]|nr:Asp-tRNA(Asn)/Glu-tRNA(Gln) amidotransferase subunit GatB [Anaerolineales bacterium]
MTSPHEKMRYEPVIGLETHIELQTRSKMFCSCPVVDLTSTPPNTAICPVCTGQPGTLPVVNAKAIEYGYRVAAALNCDLAERSVFSRKNYFYPDIPKGYQITQFDEPIGQNGSIVLHTSHGQKLIRIRRVHLEEDTGKLTHLGKGTNSYSLVDLNRAGVPLLEIVTEPDFRSAEEVRLYAEYLRALVRYLGVNSGDLEKGVMRIEPNISVRLANNPQLGTKVEIKNLNSFRALERGVAYEIERHIQLLEAGKKIKQETVGWNEETQKTVSQRSKEDAHDYRYFPEPDLPQISVTRIWLDDLVESLPEPPWVKTERFHHQYKLKLNESWQLASDQNMSDAFEAVIKSTPTLSSRVVFAWITGDIYALLAGRGLSFIDLPVSPLQIGELLGLLADGIINQPTAKIVLSEMFSSGKSPRTIVSEKNLGQVSDQGLLTNLITEVIKENPSEVESYRSGKINIFHYLFGQVMNKVQGKANPQIVREELERILHQ